MVSIAGDGRSGRSMCSCTGTALRAASVCSAGPSPAVQHRRVDTADQVTQFGKGLLGALVRGVDQGQRRVGVAVGELLLGQAQLHRQRDELRLGAVVQVALDAPQPRGGVVDGQGPALRAGGWPGSARAACAGPRVGLHQRPADPGPASSRQSPPALRSSSCDQVSNWKSPIASISGRAWPCASVLTGNGREPPPDRVGRDEQAVSPEQHRRSQADQAQGAASPPDRRSPASGTVGQSSPDPAHRTGREAGRARRSTETPKRRRPSERCTRRARGRRAARPRARAARAG